MTMYRKRDELLSHAKVDNLSLALIYSPIDLHKYIVEIISKNNTKFLKHHSDFIQFNSVVQAIAKAKKAGAEEFFLCVDTTYDECSPVLPTEHYDYIPLASTK
jgi:hypothetical protein